MIFGKPNPKLLPRAEFIRRLGWSVATGGILIFISLTLGVVGYHFLCGMAWIDSL